MRLLKIGMNRVFLCLGGNLGSRLDNISLALTEINKLKGKIVKTSSVYETEPWGSSSKNKYLNLCIELHTEYSPNTLMKKLLQIEEKMGRKRKKNKNTDRVMDIDILYFNDLIISENNVQIPHPRLHLRNFVLKPLSEIAPDFIHPLIKKNNKKLLKQCSDNLKAKIFKPQKTKWICIEGNIGVGKTTVSRALSQKLNAHFLAEEFEKNPFLKKFYANPKKYAFETEKWFLYQRFDAIKSSFQENTTLIISDFCFDKCKWFSEITLNKADFSAFKNLYSQLSKQIPRPDLLIFLTSDAKNLLANIKKRNRIFEKNIKQDYLEKISKTYIKGIKKAKAKKIIHINIKKYEKNTEEKLLKEILKEIKL